MDRKQRGGMAGASARKCPSEAAFKGRAQVGADDMQDMSGLSRPWNYDRSGETVEQENLPRIEETEDECESDVEDEKSSSDDGELEDEDDDDEAVNINCKKLSELQVGETAEPKTDMSWVETLWKKKQAREAIDPKNTPQDEAAKEEAREAGELDIDMMDEYVGMMSLSSQPDTENQPETSNGGVTKTLPDDQKEAMQEQEDKPFNIPPAYIVPAVDASDFQCHMEFYPVILHDLAQSEFAAVLSKVRHISFRRDSRIDSKSRLVEIYSERAAALLYSLMLCPFSTSPVTFELIRKKTIRKTVTAQDSTSNAPAVSSSEECSRAKFVLKTDFFRRKLGKIISVNSRENEKSRSLFISNIPATVDQILIKYIFPLARKITWVNGSENYKSAVLTMSTRKMALDHLEAMSCITINDQEVKIAVADMHQEDAEMDQNRNNVLVWKSAENKYYTETGQKGVSATSLTARTDPSTSMETKPGLFGKGALNAGKNSQTNKARTGESGKPSYSQEWREQENERGQKPSNVRLMQILEEEKKEREWRAHLRREREKTLMGIQSQRLASLEYGFRMEAENTLEGEQEEYRRSRRGSPSGGGKLSPYDEVYPHERELEQKRNLGIQIVELRREKQLQRDMAISMDLQLMREKRVQLERDIQQEIEMQQEINEMEMQLEKEKQRELKLQTKREQDEKREEQCEPKRQKIEDYGQQKEQQELQVGKELPEKGVRLEKKNQEAMSKLHLMKKEQKCQCHEQETAAQKASMQKQLDEECCNEQNEREEWECASGSRKRSWPEEQQGWEQEMAAVKKGKRNDGCMLETSGGSKSSYQQGYGQGSSQRQQPFGQDSIAQFWNYKGKSNNQDPNNPQA